MTITKSKTTNAEGVTELKLVRSADVMEALLDTFNSLKGQKLPISDVALHVYNGLQKVPEVDGSIPTDKLQQSSDLEVAKNVLTWLRFVPDVVIPECCEQHAIDNVLEALSVKVKPVSDLDAVAKVWNEAIAIVRETELPNANISTLSEYDEWARARILTALESARDRGASGNNNAAVWREVIAIAKDYDNLTAAAWDVKYDRALTVTAALEAARDRGEEEKS